MEGLRDKVMGAKGEERETEGWRQRESARQKLLLLLLLSLLSKTNGIHRHSVNTKLRERDTERGTHRMRER